MKLFKKKKVLDWTEYAEVIRGREYWSFISSLAKENLKNANVE